MTSEERYERLQHVVRVLAEELGDADEIQPGDDAVFAAHILEVMSRLRLISQQIRFVEITLDVDFDEYDTDPYDAIARQHGGAVSESSMMGEGYVFTDVQRADDCMKAISAKADELKVGVLVEVLTLDELLIADIEIK